MNINKIKSQDNSLSIEKVRLIARLKGDGSVFIGGRNKSNYFLKYEAADINEINCFAQDIENVYGLIPKFGFHRSGKNPNKLLPLTFIRSKLAYEDIMKYGPYGSSSWEIPAEILNGNKEIKIEFVRTFSEDEGSVTNGQIKIYSINHFGLVQLSDIINEFGIKNKIRGGYGAKRNVYAIIISKKENLTLFAKLIGFRSKSKNDKLEKLLIPKLAINKK